MHNFVILAILFAPSIIGTLTHEEMTAALIAAENTVTLEKTFKKYEKEQGHVSLSYALADVASVQARIPKVIGCLKMAHDSFPEDKSRVSFLVDTTLFAICDNTDTESFTNAITSFKPGDIKPLATIRFWTLRRKDAVDVLKRVMDKSPEMITHDLPSWLADHRFDQNSTYYTYNSTAREETFHYLASFATQSVLEKALSILKTNEHYKVDVENGDGVAVMCCNSQGYIPRDLVDKIEALLGLVKAKNARIREVLTFLPEVIIDLMLEYATGDIPPNSSDSRPRCIIS